MLCTLFLAILTMVARAEPSCVNQPWCNVQDPWLRHALTQNKEVGAPRAGLNSRWTDWQEMKQMRLQELEENGFPREFFLLRMAQHAGEEGGVHQNRKDDRKDGSINLGKNNDNLLQLCVWGGFKQIPILPSAREKYGGEAEFNCSRSGDAFPHWADVDNEALLARYKVDLPDVVLSSEAQKELDRFAYNAYREMGAEKFVAVFRDGSSALEDPFFSRPIPPIRRKPQIDSFIRAIVDIMRMYYLDTSKLTNDRRYAYVLQELSRQVGQVMNVSQS